MGWNEKGTFQKKFLPPPLYGILGDLEDYMSQSHTVSLNLKIQAGMPVGERLDFENFEVRRRCKVGCDAKSQDGETIFMHRNRKSSHRRDTVKNKEISTGT